MPVLRRVDVREAVRKKEAATRTRRARGKTRAGKSRRQNRSQTPRGQIEQPPPQSAPSEDEPFAVDKVAMSSAIPLRPKPTKGRTYKVICPMCETPGYTSPKAGGREVKCANPKCLVPIFTCPEPPPAPVEEAPPEPAGSSTTQLGLISLAAFAAIGAGIWFFVLRKNTTIRLQTG